MNTDNDSEAAATDLADALEAFADHAAAPGTGAGADVQVTIGTPYGIEQRTVRRVTDWITRRPERLDDTERKSLEDLGERNLTLATTIQYARRLATMVRERRSEHLALDAWLADVRLDGQPELRALGSGIRRDRAAVLAAVITMLTSGAVEGNVTRIELLKEQMYGRANFDLPDAAASYHRDQPAGTPQSATEPTPVACTH
ncbi:transposase [Kitasatospora sp. NPDC093102]|uniref:transposase n=1 Tax=Kitasatospora sp. NPDC093102 TaxID=3155069 RepID=UPI003412D953